MKRPTSPSHPRHRPGDSGPLPSGPRSGRPTEQPNHTHLYLPNRRIHPPYPEAYATPQRTGSAGNASRTLVRLWYTGRRRQYVRPGHGTYCHGHDPRRSPPISTCGSGHAVGKTYRRTLTTPHDVVPTSARTQSGHRSKKAIGHSGGGRVSTRSGDAWTGPTR